MGLSSESISHDFIVLLARDKPGIALTRLQDSLAEWVLIERPMSEREHEEFADKLRRRNPWVGWLVPALVCDRYYYVLRRERLQDLLRGKEEDYNRTLLEVLELQETGSNYQVTSDGLAYNPSTGSTSLMFRGEFAAAAVVVDSGVPVGVMPEPTRSYNMRGEEGGELTPEGERPERFVESAVSAEFPRILAKGEIGDLEVTLTIDGEAIPAERAKVLLSESHDVVVRLSLSTNLRLVGGTPSTRTKVPAPNDPRLLLYQVEALEAGPAQIIVRLFQPDRGAEQIGSLKLRSTITQGGSAIAPPVRVVASAYQPSGCTAPDLVLYIEEHQDNRGNVVLRFRITAGPQYPLPYEDWPCGERGILLPPNLYFQERFAQLEGLPFFTDDHVQAIDYIIRAEGRQLYNDLLSAEIRLELEKHGDRITSILIKTDGHHIPWEMILLPEVKREGLTRPEEFLAQRYQMTRWTEGFAPPSRIRLRKLVYVAPEYEGARRLSHAGTEVDYLTALEGLGVATEKIEDRQLAVFRALDNEPFDVFHFVGHAVQAEGKATDYSRLALGTEGVDVQGTMKKVAHTLEPVHVLGKGDRWGPRRPLVFLNACQTGRQDLGLVRSGGVGQGPARLKGRGLRGHPLVSP